MRDSQIVHALAAAFGAGDAAEEAIVARCAEAFGKRWRWLRPLARRYLDSRANAVRPRRRELVQFLREDRGLFRALALHRDEIAISRREWPPAMQPVAAAAGWALPIIETEGDLVDFLALAPTELDWFADRKSLACKNREPRLRHYRYRVFDKGNGAIRLIEAPKPRLKWIQQRILTEILNRIPPHPCAHGFVPTRSVRTFTAPHVARPVVLRLDLRDFFPSIGATRIQTLFRTLGYPEPVADLLGALATSSTPRDISRDPLHARRHLPQGAPTSPALANACFYRADCRLHGLAQSAGALYTRYADDLAFSGSEAFERGVDRFAAHVAAILHEEGFAVHYRKTRVMRQGVRQHLAGIVINRKQNLPRADFDRLKAILTNCLRTGPAAQNRDSHPDFRAHLEGRLSYFESISPEKGKRLRGLFESIQWDG